MFIFRKLLIVFFAVLFALQSPAWGEQNIAVKLEPKFGTSDDVYSLLIAISGTESKNLSDPTFEKSDIFRITQLGTTSRRQIINGKESSELGLRLQVEILKKLAPGQYQLPVGTVRIDNNIHQVPQINLTIVETATAQQSADQRIKGVSISQYLDKKEAYIGEQITYTAEITHDKSFIGGNLEDYEPNGFWRERLGDKERNVFSIKGMTVNTFQEVLIPTKAGTLEIPSRILRARLRAPNNGRNYPSSRSPIEDRFFKKFSLMQRGYYEKNLRTNSTRIEIKPLPPTSIEGYIPVGILDVSTKLDKSEIDASSSASLTISIWGTANLRPFELSKVRKTGEGSKLYFEKPKLVTGVRDGKLIFSKTFKIAVVPTKTGAIKVPSFKIDYFNTELQEYQVIETQPLDLKVVGELKSLPAEEVEKSQVEILSEDLVAQHVSPTLYRNHWSISQSTTLFISLFLLAASIAAKFYINKRILPKRKPDLFKRQFALQNAMQALERSSEHPIDACDVGLRRYLSDKLDSNATSLTGDEIQELLLETKMENSLAKEVGEQVRLIEKMRFAQSSAPEQGLEHLKQSTQNIINKLDSVLEQKK